MQFTDIKIKIARDLKKLQEQKIESDKQASGCRSTMIMVKHINLISHNNNKTKEAS